MISSLLPQPTPRLWRVGQETLAEEGALGRARSHQVVQLRVGGEEGPLRADLGGRERPGKARPVSCPPLLAGCLGTQQMGVPTCLAKAAMSSLKESEEHTSPPGGVPRPAPAPSRGEHVANSHFSKTRASSGKSGCLGEAGEKVHEGRQGTCGVWSTRERTEDPREETERPRQTKSVRETEKRAHIPRPHGALSPVLTHP